jgi:mannose-1-phosphate guanylyltransferase
MTNPQLDGEGNILAFQEKPHPAKAISTLANTGIYVLESEALEYIPEGTFFDFANDLFPRLLAAGEKFVGYRGTFYWSDVGTLEAYRTAHSDVLSGKAQVRIPGERLGESLWVVTDAQLHETVVV